jgi:hypothetical protein
MAGADFDPYAVLGVAPTAEPEAIAGAFRALAHKYHPDRNPGDADAAERMKAVNAAHDLLRDPERRRAYDAEAFRTSADAPPPPPPPPPRPAAWRPGPGAEPDAGAAPWPAAARGPGTMPRDRATAPAGHEVAGPALWLLGLGALTVLLWSRLGPDGALVAAVLVFGLLGTVRTLAWLRSRAGEGPAELLLVFGWRGAWLAILLFLPMMPLVGLASACATLTRLAVRRPREEVA